MASSWECGRATNTDGCVGSIELRRSPVCGSPLHYEDNSQARGDQLPNPGALRGTGGEPLSIDGLWALEFGNGTAAGPTGTLFFTAGPNDENDGLFGTITSH
jgi:hypothetical protein